MQREVQSVDEFDAVNCMLHFERFIQPVTAMNSILGGFKNVNLMLAKYSNLLCKEENLNHKRFDEICSEMFSHLHHS